VSRPDAGASAWSRLRRWGPAVAWAATIFALSSFSKLPSPPEAFTDKHAHVAAYAILAAAIVWGLTDGAPSRTTWRHAGVAAVLASLYGMTDEWHQSFVPGRDTSIADLAADALGACLAAGGLRAWAIIRARR
jgi:VanZ family protein